MSAGTYDFKLEQGATFTLPITYKQDGIPVVLTGVVARMQIREQYNSSTAVITLSSLASAGIVITNPGQLLVTITDEQDALLTKARYVYDLRLFYDDGTVVPVLRGQITVIPRVTLPS